MKLAHVVSPFVVVVAALFAASCDSGGDDGPCGLDVVECAAAPGTDYPGAPVCLDGNWVCPTDDAGVDAAIADASVRPDADADALEDVETASETATDSAADVAADVVDE